MAKDQTIQTLVSQEIREQLQREADLLGMTMSAYIRTVILSRQSTPIYSVVEATTNSKESQ